MNRGGFGLNKAELVAEVAERSGLTKRDAEKAVNAVVDSIEGALTKGDKVSLVGFGTFEVRERAARSGRNPRTGATLQLAASKVPAFKAGKSLKDTIAK
jgi:DNA-binding protein HU-beta